MLYSGLYDRMRCVLRLRDTEVGMVSDPDGQLSVAVYVRRQLQNTKDVLRDTTLAQRETMREL